MKAKIAEALFRKHEQYWDEQKAELRKLRAAYMTRYWDKDYAPDQILIETTRAYEYIEGYIASLYARNPSVIVKGDVRGRGDSQKVQALSNAFLDKVRTQIEDVSRLALIYPCAFLKLYATQHPDPFKRVGVSAVAAWDVVVDTDAPSWSEQKYVGHRYHITLQDAKAKYGNKKYASHQLIRFLDYDSSHDNAPYMAANLSALNESGHEPDNPFEYIQVIEFYDLESNKMYVWSPDYSNGEKWLFDGVEIEIGDGENTEVQKYDQIPFTDAANNPLAPLVPLYFSRQPDLPLRGYSALRRVYSQVEETNIIRTYQSTMVRRAARQWIVKKGVFTDEDMAKLALGADGEYIEAELSPSQNLSGSIQAVPHTGVPAELETYIRQVNDDFQRGSVLAPFTRGEATRATATEITALASYSSSEIGRLARERDAMIEYAASVYVSMMKIFLQDEPDVIVINGKTQIVRSEDLDGDFSFYALDAGATPVSEAVKKQDFLQSIGILMELGVPQQKVLQELVRKLDLPEDFLETNVEGIQDLTQTQQQPSPTATIEQGQQGSPQAVAQVL
tara:strand:- start:1835 stop:3520 length:1686 start_codon:yes stop_codon:yes gene_type:complete